MDRIQKTDDVNISHLRLFREVVQHGSLTEGARRQGLSQSAASQAVAQIEAELKTPLLDRSRRPLALTAAGCRFHVGVTTLLEGWDQVIASVRPDPTAGLSGTVTVAAIYSLGIHLLSGLVQQFTTRYPLVRVRMQYLRPDMVVQAVREKRADLGILAFPPASRQLETIPLRDEPLVVVCHPAHRLVPRRRVHLGDLAGQAMVAFDRDLAIRRAIDAALRSAGTKVEVVMEFDNVESIKQAVQNNCGLAILPEPTVIRETVSRLLVALPIEGVSLMRPVGAIRRARPRPDPAVDAFLAFITERLREDQPVGGSAPVAPVRYGQTPSPWE